ncbi:MAG: DNA translocase FtsK, partial [Nocardioidaceae bacterium]|nr:DNA translocase FtsK [Nocardioidaceae bacterium]
MATRTSSPPGSRSRNTSSARSTSARKTSSSRSRSTPKKKPQTKSSSARQGTARRPAPRAVRTGPGPVLRLFGGIGRGLAALWLAIAHGLGALARAVGNGAKEIEPEQRRDGAGLLLCGLALIIAAAVWFEVPGEAMEFVRTCVSGTIGKVGWFAPLLVLLAGYRLMRDPVGNGPVGRQVIGWSAFSFGLLGIVHIANGSPEPMQGDTSAL